ncbi:hypothetical protein O3G_MSEX007567 [Manduca sexta]|uniref:Uncharacterized protein n=1 Tax=Manduca sexta TaxID=7130 RepID=A0A922CNE0_MANSE|nr:hypothetical protein O3G_MSEX007567 [Manduca sexta]
MLTLLVNIALIGISAMFTHYCGLKISFSYLFLCREESALLLPPRLHGGRLSVYVGFTVPYGPALSRPDLMLAFGRPPDRVPNSICILHTVYQLKLRGGPLRRIWDGCGLPATEVSNSSSAAVPAR